MAAPTVAGVNSGSQLTDATTHTVTFDTPPSSGDLLIIEAVIDGNPTVTGPSGFTEKYNAAHSGGAFKTCIWRKQATGSEGASITFSTGTAEESRWSVQRITGHENPATQDIEVTSADSSSNDANPNPPSNSPTGGSKDYRVIPFFGCDTGNLTVSVWPYAGNNVSQSGSSTGSGVTLGSCDAAVTAASIDPSTFTISATRPWTAHTIVVHPVSAGGITGTAAPTEGADTSSASGVVTVSGSATPTEASDAASATGVVTVSGSIAATESADISSASGTVSSGTVGTASPTESADTPSAAGIVSVIGAAATTEGLDTSSANGIVGIITGTVAANEDGDIASASGFVGFLQDNNIGGRHASGLWQ